jgi:hypothetical protein
LARGIIENITVYEKKEITMALRDPLERLDNVEVILEKYRHSEVTTQKQMNKSLVDPFSGKTICQIGDSTTTTTTRLAREVMEAIHSDPMYGPRFDKERNYIGIEYEILLERALQSLRKFQYVFM